MNFIRRIGRDEMYIKYVHQLVNVSQQHLFYCVGRASNHSSPRCTFSRRTTWRLPSLSSFTRIYTSGISTPSLRQWKTLACRSSRISIARRRSVFSFWTILVRQCAGYGQRRALTRDVQARARLGRVHMRSARTWLRSMPKLPSTSMPFIVTF